MQNKLFEIKNGVSWHILVVKIKKTGLEVGIGLGCI